MSTKPTVLAEQVIFVVGGATDAPGFKIVSDGHGGIKVVPIPGWNPEQAAELGAALRVLASAAPIKQPDASKAILNSAVKLVSSELTHLTGPAAGGQTTVVVVS